jgi:hypothetical protein
MEFEFRSLKRINEMFSLLRDPQLAATERKRLQQTAAK